MSIVIGAGEGWDKYGIGYKVEEVACKTGGDIVHNYGSMQLCSTCYDKMEVGDISCDKPTYEMCPDCYGDGTVPSRTECEHGFLEPHEWCSLHNKATHDGVHE